jgi:hypothetical protein
MNSKELFSLFLRILGVLGIMVIIRHVLHLGPSFTTCPPVFVIVKWVIGVLVGLYLIRGAPCVVRFAFPEKPGNPA